MNEISGPLLIRPSIFSGIPGLTGLQTTRAGGVSCPPFDSLNLGAHTADDDLLVQENLKRLSRHLHITPGNIVFTEQVHGTRVCRVTRTGNVSGYDALITDTPGIHLGIVTADCYPVLIHDRRNRASAAIHAGWQGTAGHIADKTMEAMSMAFGTRPEECVAWVGTGISARHYETSSDVAGHFDDRHLTPSPVQKGKFLLDLSRANHDQLLAAGIPSSQVECSAYCSWRDQKLFFSYRRDQGVTGRMLSLIGFTIAD
jgi:hypothetical protein